MSEQKHTPGPWKEGDYILWPSHSGDAQFPIHAKKRGRIALALRKQADARLIAAAPELLEALRGLLPVTFTGNPTRAEEVAHWTREKELGNGQAAAVLAAYAAIAKATGVPQP